jgi:hypothetical protein
MYEFYSYAIYKASLLPSKKDSGYCLRAAGIQNIESKDDQ